ncbi:MAG: SAM-dependent methyltransferase [Dehalococcoidia bacterium]
MTTPTRTDVPGSFRDPCGVVFERDGGLYREVRRNYQARYDQLMEGGLYQALVEAELLVPHEEVTPDPDAGPDTYRVLRPERVPFISYPYEWSFSQLRAAALATLRIQRMALQHGMSLRDASAYNIQFRGGKPVLIDTLSFEAYEEGQPWPAYRQFCQHFLAPLALMGYRDIRLGNLLRVHLDGVPLDLAASLLPWRTRLRPSLLMHIHLHARSQRRHGARQGAHNTQGRKLSRNGLLGLLDSLRGSIRGLRWRPEGTEWAEYEQGDSYTVDALEHKEETVRSFLERAGPASVWDLGANTGRFSRIAAELGALTLAFDLDPAAVERHWRACNERGEQRVLPLVLDLTNPSPALGWAHNERMSFAERGPVGLVMALALVHHMAIGNNVPLPRVASFLASLAPWLVVEFVPREDPKARLLLAGRDDIFPGYTQAGFEAAFEDHYRIEAIQEVRDSRRVLYLMRRK